MVNHEPFPKQYNSVKKLGSSALACRHCSDYGGGDQALREVRKYGGEDGSSSNKRNVSLCPLHANQDCFFDRIGEAKRKMCFEAVREKRRLHFEGSPVACTTRVQDISSRGYKRECNGIRNLLPRKLDPPDTFNEVAAAALALTGFQLVSRVSEMRGHSALLSALVERWRPETHTFHLSVGEVTVTLEDVSYILDLPINGEAIIGRSDSSHQFLVENYMACFGREPSPQDHVLGKVNIAWVRRCRGTERCDTQQSIERYVRTHIFCVLGTIVFSDKSTTSLNSKFLPLLRDFDRISSYSWGEACLAHLYRSLCRTSRYRCKEMDGPLILLFVWAWKRMPLLTLIPRD
ncbi:uncharacterized protein DS421_9g262240 [Arachis hypogaea]|nr:uncharacterized protein DS421_9g262240 [Arachis hypogaea]